MSEIAISRCFVDPWYAESIAGDLCAPSTTKEDDAYKGKWVRIPRNLNMQSGLMSLVRTVFTGSYTSVSDVECVGTHGGPHVPSLSACTGLYVYGWSLRHLQIIPHRARLWGPHIYYTH